MKDQNGNEVPDQEAKRIELAREYMLRLRALTPEQIKDVMARVAGEYFSTYMMSYAQRVMSAQPEGYVSNGSALLILGYLIRAEEERVRKPVDVTFFHQDKVGQA